MRLSIRREAAPHPDRLPVEVVERKGRGHPDTLCDAIAEEASLALSRFYLERFGRILHHNVDKVLLAAGRASPRFGGGYEDWYRHEGRRADRLERRVLGALLERLRPCRSIVEVGSGTGHFTRWLARCVAGPVVGLDRSLEMLHHAPREGAVSYVLGDAHALPFPDRSFDVVVFVTTLEFVADPRRALVEAFRVARRGLLVGVLNRRSLLGQSRARKGGPIWREAHLFTVGELRRLVREAAGGAAVRATVRTPLWPPLAEAEVALADLPPRFVACNPEGIRLLVAGKLGSLGPGAGCDGPIAKIVRDLRVTDLGPSNVTLVDHKAGFEDMARGALTSLDRALVVVDPTSAAVEMAASLARMVAAIREGVPPATRHLPPELADLAVRRFRESRVRGVGAVLNRARSTAADGLLRAALAKADVPVLGHLDEEPKIQEQWLRGQRVFSERLLRGATAVARSLEAAEERRVRAPEARRAEAAEVLAGVGP